MVLLPLKVTLPRPMLRIGVKGYVTVTVTGLLVNASGSMSFVSMVCVYLKEAEEAPYSASIAPLCCQPRSLSLLVILLQAYIAAVRVVTRMWQVWQNMPQAQA